MALWQRKVFQVMKRFAMVTLLFFVLTYIGASFVDFSYYTGNRPWASQPKCFNSKEHTDSLIKDALQTHLILDSMGIEHWLMYGSLWGPLRGIPGPLSWDHDVDLGIDGNGTFSKIPLEEFKARFKAAGLGIEDRLESSSSIRIAGDVEMYVFYDYRGTMMRTGYETWVFYFNYRLYHCFPAKLVQQPLPKVKFGSFNISVPRGGLEVMKHLYPFNWWKVVKPASCEKK